MVTGNGRGRRVSAASETHLERPAAAREGGAIHGTWSARDEADQADFGEHTKAGESPAGARRETPRRARRRAEARLSEDACGAR